MPSAKRCGPDFWISVRTQTVLGRVEMATRQNLYDGPALLSFGFRPFFLLGSLFAGFSILLWLPQFYGELELATLFPPLDWHVHEMFFGYVTAVVTGFLFTAVPNWTGRMPIRGNPLLLLVLIWIGGRIAVLASAYLGWLTAMFADIAFLAAIVLVIGNEITAGKNWKNIKVLLPLIVLLAANTGFHLEAHFTGTAVTSGRLALAAALTLIMIIGGRIIPSFTRNWLVRENPGRLPAKIGRFDFISIAVAVLALVAWVLSDDRPEIGVLLMAAALLHVIRLGRWAGDRTPRDPLVAILHVGYLFVPLGYTLLGSSQIWPDEVPAAAGIHALSVGAIGTMTLSVMVRATLGHTGQALKAGFASNMIFSSIVVSALARIAAAFLPDQTDILLHLAAFTWFAAFAGFGIVFAPAMVKPRVQQ